MFHPCPPTDATGPAHLGSSLGGGFPAVGSRKGIQVSERDKTWDRPTRGRGARDYIDYGLS